MPWNKSTTFFLGRKAMGIVAGCTQVSRAGCMTLPVSVRRCRVHSAFNGTIP